MTQFMYGLFNGAVSNSTHTGSNCRMMVENVIEMMWKERAVASFEVLSQHWPGGGKKTKNHLRHDSCCTSQDLNRISPEYKTELLPHELTCWMIQLRPVNKRSG
jgi:hypothetical protein